MARSDSGASRRWAAPVALAAVAVVVGAFALSAFDGGQDDRLADLERAFEDDREAFEDGVELVEGLAAAAPDARRIGWSLALVCVTYAAGDERCTDTDEAQRSAFQRLAGANTVVRQAKDGGRVFFVFDVEDPPVSYLVRDPEARDPEAYADAQGFDWGRELDDGWSALGHIGDVEQQSSMWVD